MIVDTFYLHLLKNFTNFAAENFQHQHIMIKKSMNSGLAGYSAPCCKFVAVSAKKLICASNYGESGYAGGVFNSGNTNTYDGDDDLL